MARPKKNNADYFPHDKDMRNDPKVRALRNEFGMVGYGVWNMTLESLCHAKNLEIEYTDLNKTLMSGDFGISTTEMTDIISFCDRIELLSIENDVLTSNNLRKRLEPMFQKREYLRQKYESKGVSTTEINSNDTSTEITGAENTQSKGKVKIKESKKKVTKILKPENVTEQTWSDWKKHRNKKKAIITQNVINGFESQAKIAGWTLEQALIESVDRGWSGFKAEWVKKDNTGNYKNNSYNAEEDAKRLFSEES